MNDALFSTDGLFTFERTHLERLRLAAGVLLELAGEPALPEPVEVELTLFKERVEHTLLLPGQGAGWLEPIYGPITWGYSCAGGATGR